MRAEIDERGLPGQFILAGSAAANEDKTRHTGAGRFSRILLRPMTLFEQGISTAQVSFNILFETEARVFGQGGPSVEEYAAAIVKGGWPGMQNLSSEAAHTLLQDYVDNIADIDLRYMDSPPDPVRMATLIRAIARNISTEATLEKLAAEAGIDFAGLSVPTVRKYLDQLTRVFVLEELPAWGVHLRSSIRMRVKPKWHFVDPSLATAALGATVPMLMNDLNMLGLLFESMAVRDLRVYAESSGAKVFHYRDSTDLEIDAIVERRDGTWAAIEIKLGGEKAIDEAAKNFTKLKNRMTQTKLKNLAMCAVVTAGEFSYIRSDGVAVIALGHLGVPITDDEVVAAFWSYINERSDPGVVIAKTVSNITLDDRIVRVTFDPKIAHIDLKMFDLINPFDNLAEFMGVPIMYDDALGAQLRPAIDAIETVLVDGTSLGTLTAAKLYRIGTGKELDTTS